MAFTRVVGPGIHTQANIDSHNIHSTGIITATKFDGPFDSLSISGNLSIGGTLTYEDVTNIDSVGLITARQGIEVGAEITRSFHRFVLQPGELDDSDNFVDNPLDKEPDGTTAIADEVKAICTAVWTDAIKTAWKAKLIADKSST